MKLKPALREARDVLDRLSVIDHSGVDIRVRTELSYSRQTLAMVKELLFGRGKAGRLRERLLGSERKMNDLLQYVDRVLALVREVGSPFSLIENSTRLPWT